MLPANISLVFISGTRPDTDWPHSDFRHFNVLAYLFIIYYLAYSKAKVNVGTFVASRLLLKLSGLSYMPFMFDSNILDI